MTTTAALLSAHMNSLPEATEGGIPSAIALPVDVVCLIVVAILVARGPAGVRQPVVFLLIAAAGVWGIVLSRNAFSIAFFCLSAVAAVASSIDSRRKQ